VRIGASSVLDHRFGAGAPYTLGAEEEFMLLDPETWELVPRIETVLAAAAGSAFESRISPELLQSVLEVTTPVCASAAELGAQLRRLRRYVSEVGAANGFRFASAGTHPFSRFERQLVTDGGRYRAMVAEFQIIARQQLIFGLHIHAAVDDAEKAIQVVDGTLLHAPELLALSANSPLWRGAATGLSSCRQMILSALPRTGMPPRFESYAEYAETVGELEASGCVSDYTRMWWDVRLHPQLGTVELRICDGVTRLEDAVALAAYFQALVKLLCEQVESGRRVARFHPVLTTENKWLAARHGLRAELIDLAGGRGNRIPVSELVRRTLRALAPHARELGSERELEGIVEILARGNGADAQLRAWNDHHDPVAVVRALAEASEVGTPAGHP
jgi:glutamate---cysteine ligase / carboxylate-amine ligase